MPRTVSRFVSSEAKDEGRFTKHFCSDTSEISAAVDWAFFRGAIFASSPHAARALGFVGAAMASPPSGASSLSLDGGLRAARLGRVPRSVLCG